MTPNIINGKKELPSFERELVDGFQGAHQISAPSFCHNCKELHST
jgi:hypothetical protein